MLQQQPPEGSSLPPKPPKRKRNRRTVYSVEQREELERFFENNQYPCYSEREALAATLNLQEQQVQVWFQNHRSRRRRQHGGTGTRQRGPKARASPHSPGVCGSAPAPPAAGPGYPEDPLFASGPEFPEDLELAWGLLRSSDGAMLSEGPVVAGGSGSDNPWAGVPAAAEPSASSHVQAPLQAPLQAPPQAPQDAQDLDLAAPAPPAAVPVWLEDCIAGDVVPDLNAIDLLSL